ncbi:MAG: peptidoglycan DD-metalloendopeptidase family protein [Sulfurovum sp.]|nr:peptidoglycan DD-metalloendopeptidase family protein [Sulfurovum sp.]
MPLFAQKVIESKWQEEQTFEEYLISRNIPKDFIESISEEDQKFLSEINKNDLIYELKDDNNTLLQALIPISKVMQIHIAKQKDSKQYLFDIIPIEYTIGEYYAKVVIENNPYTDTLQQVKNKNLANRLSSSIKNAIDGKKLKKGDEINFIYTQEKRMGNPVLMPDVKAVRVKMRDKETFIYVDKDGDGYTKLGESVAYQARNKESESAKFGMPLRNIRITSSFSYSRYHPILKRNRPHHGTDFGASKGTPLLAVHSGKITYASRMGTYGNVVKIKHSGGYESLYAHQSRIAVKHGQRVKKGQVIGYVGSTGRSTGPHLHFGLQKNGRWINPMDVLGKKSIGSTQLKNITEKEDVKKIKYKTVNIKGAKMYKTKLLRAIKVKKPSFVW